MNNQHNPIARLIESLQYRWMEETANNPDYKLTYWLIEPDEAAVINGFYKLESTQYGALPEFFLVMFSPFENYHDYSGQLIEDILNLWEQDPVVKETDTFWDTAHYRKKLVGKEDPDAILLELLTDFQKSICGDGQQLVLGVIPRSVKSFYEYNNWLIDIGEMLPSEVKLSVLDHIGKDYLKKVRQHYKKRAIVFKCGDFNLHEVMRQMATSGGDPNAPDVNFRKCVFEMADGVSSKNMDHIHTWGKQGVQFAQMSGSKSFYATAFLVYAGFLMQRKSNDANPLLDQGIHIAETAIQDGDAECVTVLIQLYGFKAAFYSIKNNSTKASYWMLKQAACAAENNLGAYAISLSRMSARMAKKAGDEEAYRESLKIGYHAGDTLEKEELMLSEIATLAYYYAEELEKEKENGKAAEIRNRMSGLFGEEWEEAIVPLMTKYGETIPGIEETMETINVNS